MLNYTDSAGMIAFDPDGTVSWAGPGGGGGAHAIALADLDNDGHVEVIHGNTVWNDAGEIVMQAPVSEVWIPAAADLDGDGDQEVVYGYAAYHHDGTPYYTSNGPTPHFPQIADWDEDGLPEVIVTSNSGITVLEHDGVVKISNANPGGQGGWIRPAAIHDVDGDDSPELVVGTADEFAAIDGDMTAIWFAPVDEASGFASGTAFDFLGLGTAQAIYADEGTLRVFDEVGDALMQVPRSSWTQLEYPVIADVDNDGSAELVVTSAMTDGQQTAPTLQVIRDAEDRWIPARRIWNQHTYHVTNVREDATIPAEEQPHWEQLNTYRTQAQSEGGSICIPEG